MAGTIRMPLSAAAGWAGASVPEMTQGKSLHRSRLVLCAVLAIMVGVAAEGRLWVHYPLLTSVNLLCSTAFVVTGLMLLADREHCATAWALLLAGITFPLGWLDQWEAGPLPLYSVVFGYLSDILGALALLRYPASRLDPARRRFCVLLAIWFVLGPLLLVLISRPAWWGPPIRDSAWWLALWPSRTVFDAAQQVFDFGALALAGTFVVLLAGRLRTSSRDHRIILLPVVTAGLLAAVAAGAVMIAAAVSRPTEELFTIEGAVQLAVPVAFLVSILQQRLFQVTGMVAQLEDAPPADLLRRVLRANLRDPELELAVWSAAEDAHQTVDGAAADIGVLASGRRHQEVSDSNNRPLAILFVDPSVRDRNLLNTAVVLTRLTLENAQLSDRLVTASDEARRQLAADLHDGVQNKLWASLMALSAASESADDNTRCHFEQTRLRIGDALSELRNLARGVYPPALSLGLRAAVEDTVRHLDLPADIRIPNGALPPAVERTLYFMICEALTNVHRHARATSVTVTVRHGNHLAEATITDNGVGGADPQGTGLSNMRDRARARGGSLTIDSVPGGGTTLTMSIPCA
jgi:signal transduction histidine kinase